MTHRNNSIHSNANVRWQAAYWWLRLKERRALSAREGLRFLGWIRRSPMHLQEFLFFQRLDAWLTRSMRGRQERSNVTHVDFRRGSALAPAPPQAGRRHLGSWSVAAAATLLLPVIFFLAHRSEEHPDRQVTTAAHELKTQKLEDGSEVSLGSASTLRVQFTDARRAVQLPQGQATFNVVMDMKRPFVVSTALVDIAAVESKFSVNLDTSVEVMVYEGMVAITARDAPAGAAVVRVKKGERYRVPVSGLRTVVADRGTTVNTQWTRG